MKKPAMKSMRYRPDIEGLRAVAVLLVIFHHLGDWAGTRGGYVGVDVFFVISGYLITSIVKSEVKEGSFSFRGFYKRRIVRLAPAYFTVLIATTIAALVWMLPSELLAYARSMAASSVFLANFHMWKEVGGYFGGDAHSVPLLHLWSLAVEEQFYLFWPVVLMLVHRFALQRLLPWLILAIVIGGTLVSQWGVSNYPAAAYYLLPTRFFELAVGALLAYLPSRAIGRSLAAIASFSGITLIAYAAVAYGTTTLFPGYAALAPVLGTALLLRYGEGTIVGRALGTSVMTLIGKISYPAYLWHWPIIAFLYINEIAINLRVGLAVLAATLALSWLTYRWVELPARRLLVLPARRVFFAGFMPVVGVVVVTLAFVRLDGFPARFPESMNRKSEALLSFPNKDRGRCNQGPPSAPLPPDKCVLGRSYGDVDLLLVGDSHANHFSGFVDVLGLDANLRGYDITQSSTPFLLGGESWTMLGGSPIHRQNFISRNQFVAGLIERERYRYIVLAGNYTAFSDEMSGSRDAEGRLAFETGMRRAIEVARSSAERVFLLPTIPLLPEKLHDCPLRAERFSQVLDCTLPAENHFGRTEGVRAFFSELKREFPDLVWIDADRLLCDQGRCVTEIDGIPLYKDSGHLNVIGSRLLAKKWIARYGNPLKGDPEDGAVLR